MPIDDNQNFLQLKQLDRMSDVIEVNIFIKYKHSDTTSRAFLHSNFQLGLDPSIGPTQNTPICPLLGEDHVLISCNFRALKEDNQVGRFTIVW